MAKTRINSATTTQVKNGPGVLERIIVTTPIDTETIGLIDGTSGSTVNIATITNSGDIPFSLEFGARFSSGLRIVTSGTSDILVVWK